MSKKNKFKKDSPFEGKEFSVENVHGLDPKQVEDIKSTPGHSRDKKFEQEIEHKQEEFMQAMEGSEDTGRDYVEHEEKEKISRHVKQKEEVMNYLDMSADFASYRANIAEYGMWLMMSKFFPVGYEYHCVPSKEGTMNIYGKTFDTQSGIIFVLKEPKGKVYIQAMKCYYDPTIDVPAIQLMAVNVENTVDMLEGNLMPTKTDPKSIMT